MNGFEVLAAQLMRLGIEGERLLAELDYQWRVIWRQGEGDHEERD